MTGRTVFVIVLLFAFSMSEAQKTGVQFEQRLSWAKILKKAKREHKYIFVDCYATWCRPCKMMDAKVYSADTVGNIVNREFISVKIQCDSTRNDGPNIKARYADAYNIVNSYGIVSYPTLLFFLPDGKLVHKGIGYQDPRRFCMLIATAVNTHKQYYTLVENYKNGKMLYADMPDFAKLVRDFEDKQLYETLSKDFIQNYLNQLNDVSFLSKKNLEAAYNFVGNINSKDKIFELIKNDKLTIDTLMGRKGYAMGLVNAVINKEEISPVLRLSKRTQQPPHWDSISNNIVERFGAEYVNYNIARAKTKWFEFTREWENFSQSAIDWIQVIQKDTSRNGTIDLDNLNTFAFNVFLHSNDKVKLEIALSWVNEVTDSMPHAGEYLDTKANLLYKLGKIIEAIKIESLAASLRPDDTQIRETCQKMKEGKPTW